MFNPFKKFLEKFTESPDEEALDDAQSRTLEEKFIGSDADLEERSVKYALGLYKKQHKENGTDNPYPWL